MIQFIIPHIQNVGHLNKTVKLIGHFSQVCDRNYDMDRLLVPYYKSQHYKLIDPSSHIVCVLGPYCACIMFVTMA